MEEQLNAALKQQLRDVHLPGDVGWWPLAYGWWISIALSLLGIIALICYFLRKRKKNAYRRTGINELTVAYVLWQKQADVTAYLQSANAILKRAVLHFSREHTAASQSGITWLNTIESTGSQKFTSGLKEALALQVYQANSQADVNAIHQELCNWFKSHKANGKPNALDSVIGSPAQSGEVSDA